ncbi:hypothetical protein GcC1_094021d [Golovinomyces cichoracearum]|uniref:Uncharacterized protein n=1 Tax=Golovinomyces cichoracearum TaxID=62708 RepID=A0A420ICT3_9PEZI|nr:hypothetical protein GcC1_094021d [Golovinomyces cichoracearum]
MTDIEHVETNTSDNATINYLQISLIENKEIEYHAVDSDSDSGSNGNIDDIEVTQNYLDIKIPTANLIQGAYENAKTTVACIST